MNSFEEKSTRAVSANYRDLILQKYAPPCLLLNQEEKILLINGTLEKYLPVKSKMPGHLLADFVDKTIYRKLQKGISEVANGEESVLIEGEVLANNAYFYYYISSLTSISTAERLILIEFEDIKEQSNSHNMGNASAHELQQQIDTLARSTEHDVKNLFTNFVLLLNLEESSYTKADKIHDMKEMQENLLFAFKKNIDQVKGMLNLPSSDE